MVRRDSRVAFGSVSSILASCAWQEIPDEEQEHRDAEQDRKQDDQDGTDGAGLIAELVGLVVQRRIQGDQDHEQHDESDDDVDPVAYVHPRISVEVQAKRIALLEVRNDGPIHDGYLCPEIFEGKRSHSPPAPLRVRSPTW